MINRRLTKPIVLIPLAESELESINNKKLYVLYKSSHIGGIQVEEVFYNHKRRKHTNDGRQRRYFYKCDKISNEELKTIERPVYLIICDNTTVLDYSILNKPTENITDVWLDNIIDGSYIIKDTPKFKIKKKPYYK